MRHVLVSLVLMLISGTAVAQEGGEDRLAALAAFVGKTWAGQGDGPNGAVVKDVSRWEWILGGRAIRIVHAVNGGTYGGQTTIYPDPDGDGLRFHYVTTGGFVTEGSSRVEDGNLISLEKVTGHPEITEVRSTASLDAETGVMTTQSEYLKNGEWETGHGFVYREEPDAQPDFPPVR